MLWSPGPSPAYQPTTSLPKTDCCYGDAPLPTVMVIHKWCHHQSHWANFGTNTWKVKLRFKDCWSWYLVGDFCPQIIGKQTSQRWTQTPIKARWLLGCTLVCNMLTMCFDDEKGSASDFTCYKYTEAHILNIGTPLKKYHAVRCTCTGLISPYPLTVDSEDQYWINMVTSFFKGKSPI